jgi:hypothetical protein
MIFPRKSDFGPAQKAGPFFAFLPGERGMESFAGLWARRKNKIIIPVPFRAIIKL